MEFANEKEAASQIVSQISLKLIFPKLSAKSKSSNHSTYKDMLLRKVYLGSYLKQFSYSCCILILFSWPSKWLLSKRFPHQTAKTSSLCYREVAGHHNTIQLTCVKFAYKINQSSLSL
jgi:hypothetical protein